MTRSRLHGRIPALWWGLAAIAAASQPALAGQDRAAGDRAGTSAPGVPAPQRPSAPPSAAPPPATRSPTATPPAAAPDQAAPLARDGTVAAAVAPTAAGRAPPPAPDPTEGDRDALINQDVIRHPPQMQIPSRDPSHLQTARMRLGGLLDRSVRSVDNSEVGRVIDVMTGDDGRPAALELDVGGFLGVGNRRIAVAWTLFDLSRTGQNDPLRVALSAAQVRSAPAMDEAGEVQVVTGAAPIGAPPSVAAGQEGDAQPAAPASPGTAPVAPAPAATGPAAAAPPAPGAVSAGPVVSGSPGATPREAAPATSARLSPPSHAPAAATPAAVPTGHGSAEATSAPSSSTGPATRSHPAAPGHKDRDANDSPAGGGEERF